MANIMDLYDLPEPSWYIQGGAPPVISLFITPFKYRYIYHKPK